jgi:hypothetical protein
LVTRLDSLGTVSDEGHHLTYHSSKNTFVNWK